MYLLVVWRELASHMVLIPSTFYNPLDSPQGKVWTLRSSWPLKTRYIDQGRNPQLYTKECLERALAKNEQVKGKIDTMKKFKSLLIQELTKVFPEDMAKYKAIRGEEPPP
ncbi:mediator of RNA polymerase II transcription subunit 10 isoform X2 [Trachemys scripta elegans]|uniref:mediator of RNA polymerase II transcription subunit 10 isoform X2 n=1 Tax=Trachemys scripta elegans TaxID=31138 RepID=UPI000388FF72|nr:mediator of RNA polymerase II transcription subunit 10 isoform X2 [Trachemys scripta elegans]XP_042715789.1 mediator of RNA polymerase II transcription subunit 10 isoform X2 [Chrysemys picta bellii]